MDLTKSDYGILILAISAAIQSENEALVRLHHPECGHGPQIQAAIRERVLLLKRYDVLRLNLSSAAMGNGAPAPEKKEKHRPHPGGIGKRRRPSNDDDGIYIPTRPRA